MLYSNDKKARGKQTTAAGRPRIYLSYHGPPPSLSAIR